MSSKREMLSADQQQAAWSFIKEASLGHALSRFINPVLKSEAGTLSVLIDVDISVDRIERFQWGFGHSPVELSDHIASWIPANGLCVAIFDDVMGSPRNYGMAEVCSTISQGDELFHFIDLANCSLSDFQTVAVVTAVSWHFLCVIVEGTDIFGAQAIIRGSGEIPQDVKILAIFFGAFDQEGFLFWTPNAEVF